MALAAALALLAMLGVASGFWPVVHQNVNHAAAHTHEHHDGEHNPDSDEAPRPLDHDCPVSDLIAGSSVLLFTQPLASVGAATPSDAALPHCHQHLFRQVDLTAWSARPPPPCA